MKKMMKCVAGLSAMLVLMSALTGCRQFEELRQAQASFTKEGNLLVKGEEYLALPLCDELRPMFHNDVKEIYAASEETPVLLTKFFGTTMDMSEDKMFIASGGYNIYNGEFDGVGIAPYYCHEDIYDSVMATIETGYEPNGYRIGYFDWQEDEFKHYEFSDEETQAVETVFAQTPAYESEPESWDIFSVDSYMKDQPFSQYEFDLVKAEDGIYLNKYFEINENWLYYKVPTDLEPVFQNVIDTCNLEK